MYYLLENECEQVSKEEAYKHDAFAAVLKTEEADDDEFCRKCSETVSQFSRNTRFCKTEVYSNVIYGSFSVPNKKTGKRSGFSYFFDKNHLVFIDDSGMAHKNAQEIVKNHGENIQSPGRFLFYFSENLILDDLILLIKLDDKLSQMDSYAVDNEYADFKQFNHAIMSVRKIILSLTHYYSQLSDCGDVFVKNENGFFDDETVSFFRLFSERTKRLSNEAQRLWEYSAQIREVYQAQIDIRQNIIMKILTIVTTVFMPLTLITGWYGMNFDMPELKWKYGYPFVFAVSLVVVLLSIWICKKRKFW
jgi:magnesium transporter